MELGVNIDHIATLRNARGGSEPDVLRAALICEKAGAFGITTHLREDRRHIKDSDVDIIKANINIPLNLEMAATDEIQKIALKVLPNSCCLVPEKRQEITTEGGLNVAGQINYLKEYIKPLQDKGILISLFIDPEENQVKAAAEIGAEYIEMHTGSYSEAKGEKQEVEFQKLKNAAILAQSLGLKVNAGHGLNYQNVLRMKEIPNLCELNIGHSIISLAVFEGLETAVKKMKDIIS